MTADPKDVDALKQEKYGNDRTADGFPEDVARLENGEPLAYVIGHIPFLGLSLALDSRPLIPRPETEWWTELLCNRIGDAPLRILDLCAGSGAIGLSVLARCQSALVSFGELSEMDVDQIGMNLERNNLDAQRADIRQGDLFAPFQGERFDIIATNPPYVPEGRILPESVVRYEPHGALYAGPDGLGTIRRILTEAPAQVSPQGEVWMECDTDNIQATETLASAAGFTRTKLHTDQYGRPRLLVSYL